MLSVWVDQFSLSVMCTPGNLTYYTLHYCPVDVDRELLPLLFPEVHDHLLCFVDIECEVIVNKTKKAEEIRLVTKNTHKLLQMHHLQHPLGLYHRNATSIGLGYYMIL